ncbi:hypothetical protein NDK43_13465 [Neobacillus pocheonensis]|uniref:Uncharacterized protein n=1 Tax=Neobacillus pocheonensis TaxID=363869 RepID=A0ABT0WA62_9BACI|nr:hypothetical protein [Neobacillus pocheonensis]
MFKYFSFKKRQIEKENKFAPLILTKLDRIIELLEHKQKETEVKNIHFDHVQIDNLENIVFRLDNLEIDELSGKLIIGNNIGSTEDLSDPLFFKIDKENSKKETMSETTSPTQKKMTKTAKGYRFRNHF